jgi:hypothetical protein
MLGRQWTKQVPAARSPLRMGKSKGGSEPTGPALCLDGMTFQKQANISINKISKLPVSANA